VEKFGIRSVSTLVSVVNEIWTIGRYSKKSTILNLSPSFSKMDPKDRNQNNEVPEHITSVLISLENLQTSATSGQVKINHFSLITDSEVARSFINYDPEIPIWFGRLRLTSLLRMPFLLTNVTDDFLKENGWQNVETASFYDVITMQYFLLHLWLIKDNSANIDNYFCHNKARKQLFTRSRSVTFSNCVGEFKDETFSKEELEAAWSIFEKSVNLSNSLKYKGKSNRNDKGEIGTQSMGLNSVAYNTHNRITRALLFLQAARSTTMITTKITYYTGILECLFSTAEGDISHKVSERVAYYLGQNQGERLDLFRFIKKMYDVRSKYIHGQSLSKKIKTVDFLSESCIRYDGILRQVHTKAITKDADVFVNTGNIDEWYLKLTL
jgi:hypothetical protein